MTQVIWKESNYFASWPTTFAIYVTKRYLESKLSSGLAEVKVMYHTVCGMGLLGWNTFHMNT